MEAVEKYFEEHQERILAELLAFVRIPSVSAAKSSQEQVWRAARFVKEKLQAAGPLQVEMIETENHPVVFANYHAAPHAPTVLVYGHYDVQPPEPLEEWTSPPFEPTLTDDRIVARGVSDDKAPMFIPIKVVEAFFATQGNLPINLKLLFEGEEEIGSPSLTRVVREYKERLSADFVLSADGAMWSAEHPTITTSARGICALEFSLSGPTKDLHSGRHGGSVANPLHAMASLIASLHDADGRVSVDGFYDLVEPVSEAQRRLIAALEFDEDAYLAEVGSPSLFGERGYNTLERQWYRPTLEVNGMWGGYTGEGSKTVLPRVAHAKITCRLVPGQDPRDVTDKLRRYLQAHCPAGVTLRMDSGSHDAFPYRIPENHLGLDIAKAVLEELYGKEPWTVGMGGTLPVSQTFRDVLGIETIFFSFAVGDENIHAPNEFFRLSRFLEGCRAWARYFDRLGVSIKK